MPSQSSPHRRPHVVIVGAGFAGINCAKALKNVPVDVTVVDKQNHHLFQPLLYQVATAALAAPDVSAPHREILRKVKNATVILDCVCGVDKDEKRLQLQSGETLDYDYLVVATGSRHTYFGNDDWEQYAPGLKTLADAHEIRRRILIAFEKAERSPKAPGELTFVVVGGGPTGVELAGAISEIAHMTLTRQFRRVRPEKSRVVLVEGGERILSAYSERLSAKAKDQLEELGVEVRLKTQVKGVDANGVTLDGDERIEAAVTLWGAGVVGTPIGKTLGAELHKSGRVKVDPRLFIPDHPEIFVAGDLAFAQEEPDAAPAPALAPAAMQMGRYVANAIAARVRGKDAKAIEPFHYFDKGSLATIGRSKGVGEALGMEWSGFPAWFAWLFIHLFFLIGFRNKIMVLLEWAWAYVSLKRGARIILDATEPVRAPLAPIDGSSPAEEVDLPKIEKEEKSAA